MSLFGTGRREGVLAVVLLTVLSAVLHAPGLFFGELRLPIDPAQLPPQARVSLAPADPTWREAHTNQCIVAPAVQAAGQVLADHEWPLWNRNARFGEPFAASGVSMLYPPWWLLLAPGPFWLELLLFLHTVIACACMYRFLRVLPVHRYVSFLGAAIYGLSWSFTLQLDRLPEAAAAALLPLGLELTWRTLITRGRGRARYTPMLGLALALPFLAGGTATAWLGAALCLAVFVAHLSALESEERRQALCWAGVAAGFTLLLTGPIWLDALQHQNAYLGPDGPVGSSMRRLQLGGLLCLFAPNAFGDLLGRGPAGLHGANPSADPIELALHPGALALFLLLLGLMRPKRTYLGLFWVVVGGAGVFLSLDSPVTETLLGWSGWEPGLPGVALVLTHVAITVLASLALENFFESPASRSWTVPLTTGLGVVLASAVLVLGWLSPELGERLVARCWHVTEDAGRNVFAHVRNAFLPTLGALLAIGLAFVWWRRLGIPRFKAALAIVAVADLLYIGLTGVPRIRTPVREDRFVAAVPAASGRVLTAQRTPLPPAGQLVGAGIPAVATAANAILERTAQYLMLIDPAMPQHGPRSQVMPLVVPQLLDHPLVAAADIGVGVSAGPFHAEGFAPLASAPLLPAAPGLHVASRKQVVPRARVMLDAVQVRDASVATALLRSGEVDPRNRAVIETGAGSGFVARRGQRPTNCELVADQHNRVRLRVDMGDNRAWLVLADAHAPGWEATVDGVPAEILPANLAFRAVALGEGQHDVVFTYVPWSVRFGLPLLLVYGVLALVLVTFTKRRRGPAPVALRRRAHAHPRRG